MLGTCSAVDAVSCDDPFAERHRTLVVLGCEDHGGAPVVSVNPFEAVSQVEMVGSHPLEKALSSTSWSAPRLSESCGHE